MDQNGSTPHIEVRLGGWGSEGPKAPTFNDIRQTRTCVCYYIRLRALLYQVACATILACVTLVRALVYCNFLKEVRVGG